MPSAPFQVGLRALVIAFVAMTLAACQQTNRSQGPSSTVSGLPPSASGVAVEPRRIGLLVPLTGRIAPVGQDLARAAEMALVERGGDGAVLVTRDTQSTPEGAVLAARELLEVGDVDVILGPLVGSHAQRVTELARQRNVLVLSFSSQSEIAGNGLFVLGYRPEEQVQRVAGYAVGRGFGRIAAIAPDTEFGRQTVAELRTALAGGLGGELVEAQFYGADGIDAAARIQTLAEARSGPRPFDALFIADGGERLRRVAQLLPGGGIQPVDVRMLGTMLWQDDRTALQEDTLRGGWYAGIPDTTVRDFRSRFRRAFGRDPHSLAVLGYDGLLIAADAASDPGTATARITEARGYRGEGGIIRLLPTGTAEHGLAVMELTVGGPVIVEPAPARFEDGTS